MTADVTDTVQSTGVMEPKDYDAIVLASFGGPEGQDEVLPFLRNVTAGRGIPDERLEEVATHYRTNGGVSPINGQNRALKAALEEELAARELELPVYWGNRNWKPYLDETVAQAYQEGHRRLLVLTTSAYTCYSSDRQYREDMAKAILNNDLQGKIELDKVRQFFNHPGFVDSFAEGLDEGIRSIRKEIEETGAEGEIQILFATHSIPTSDAEAAGPRPLAAELQEKAGAAPGEVNGADLYSAQHLDVAQEVLKRVPVAAGLDWRLVYQSRSGSPHTPWLEPDINDAMNELAGQKKIAGFVVVPVGFVSDHMEVVWDLDTEAKETSDELGTAFRRTPTPGTNPTFVHGLVDLIEERMGFREGRAAVGEFGAWYDINPAEDCVKAKHDGSFRPTVGAVDSSVQNSLETQDTVVS